MVPSTKEITKTALNTATEFSPGSTVLNSKVPSKTTLLMELGHTSGRTGGSISGTGRITRCMGVERLRGKTDGNTSVNTRKIGNGGRVSLIGLMVGATTVSGLTDGNMVWDCIGRLLVRRVGDVNGRLGRN